MRCEITRKHQLDYECDNSKAMPLAFTTPGMELSDWLDIKADINICEGCKVLAHWAAGRARQVLMSEMAKALHTDVKHLQRQLDKEK